MIWLTADVHYAASHHYDPDPGRVTGILIPSGNFVSGPACRDVWSEPCSIAPSVLRPGGPRDRPEPCLRPLHLEQFFGTVRIDGGTGRRHRDPLQPRRETTLTSSFAGCL